jgi:hypothetical protein
MANVRAWTVLRPSGLEQIDDNLWAIEDDVPGIPGFKRRMVVVRRDDGAIVFFNAIPVPDDTLAAIAKLGKPSYLVVPNAFHTMDAPAFREKLGLEAFGPPKSLAAVQARVPCKPYPEMPADAAVTVETVDGFKTGEGLLVVRSGPRASLVVADLVLNQPHGKGVAGFMGRLFGFTGDQPKLPKPVRLRVLEDKDKVRALLERLAATTGLARLVPSHGLVVADPAAALRAVAASL